MPQMRARASSGARTLPIIGGTNPHPQLAGTHPQAVSLAAIVSIGTECMFTGNDFTYLVSMVQMRSRVERITWHAVPRPSDDGS